MLSVIVGPPVISFINNNIISLEGDRVKLLCIATNDIRANYSLQINWYRGNELIMPNGKHILLHNDTHKHSNQLKSTLVFNPVNRTDNGEYTCRAFNHPDLYSELKTNLTVECKNPIFCHTV